MDLQYKIASVVVRVVFTVVFVVNVHCALSFVIAPDQFVDGFMLGGTGKVGEVAIAGLGVAFLMWNTTYPAFIVAPSRFPVLGWVILAQQVIGLVGESCLCAGLGSGFDALRGSLMSFLTFDGTGLVLMAIAFGWFLIARKKNDVL